MLKVDNIIPLWRVINLNIEQRIVSLEGVVKDPLFESSRERSQALIKGEAYRVLCSSGGLSMIIGSESHID